MEIPLLHPENMSKRKSSCSLKRGCSLKSDCDCNCIFLDQEQEQLHFSSTWCDWPWLPAQC
eukprot:15116787-Ditylum_brightwellii.AAC.1